MKAIEDIIDAEVIEDIEFDAPLTPRQQLLSELRDVLDLLERNPELPLPNAIGKNDWDHLRFYPTNAKSAANLVKALGGHWTKNDPNASEFNAQYLDMKAKLGLELRVEVIVSREGVCEKRVVGTEKKKVKKVVVAEVAEEVYEDVPKIEFHCKSLMSLADQKVMDELAAIAS